MIKKIENLKIESAIRKNTKPYLEIVNRKMNTFNIRIRGKVEYYFKDKTITVNEGEMIFLPKESTYKCKVISENESSCIIINMNDNFEKKEPEKYLFYDFHCADYFINNFTDLWNFGDMADKCKCMSYLYDLIFFICNHEKISYSQKKKFYITSPAIDYLKKHIFDTSLKIDELHKLCGVSNTYFRKIFILEFGISPKKYITEKRMLHAKSIIDSGEFNTVKQLALSVGYSDALYFGKVFKKYYGFSPKNINE